MTKFCRKMIPQLTIMHLITVKQISQHKMICMMMKVFKAMGIRAMSQQCLMMNQVVSKMMLKKSNSKLQRQFSERMLSRKHYLSKELKLVIEWIHKTRHANGVHRLLLLLNSKRFSLWMTSNANVTSLSNCKCWIHLS